MSATFTILMSRNYFYDSHEQTLLCHIFYVMSRDNYLLQNKANKPFIFNRTKKTASGTKPNLLLDSRWRKGFGELSKSKRPGFRAIRAFLLSPRPPHQTDPSSENSLKPGSAQGIARDA